MTAFDYLTVLMETDPSVKLLKSLDASTSESVEVDWLSLKEKQETETLERLLQFYSKNGLDFVPPSPDSVLVIKNLKEQSQIDDTPLISEAEAAAIEEDPILFAQKAARDASWSQYHSSLCAYSFADNASDRPYRATRLNPRLPRPHAPRPHPGPERRH